MRIMVDLDGVLYPFVEQLRKHVAKSRGLPASEDKFPTPIHWRFWGSWGFESKDGFDARLRQAVDFGGLFRSGAPPSDAVRSLERLRAAGHSVHLATKRSHGTRFMENTEDWLNTHKIPYDTVSFVSDKSLLNVDAAVDDNPSYLDELPLRVRKFLYHQPWNAASSHRKVNSLTEMADDLLAGTEEGPPIGRFHLDDSPTFSGRSETRVVVNPTTGGQKGTKPERYSLLPTGPLAEVARVYHYGAGKYDDHNWRKGYAWSLSFDALQRHAQTFWGGETRDPESGLHHLAHAVFHCLTLIEWDHTHRELDDRP